MERVVQYVQTVEVVRDFLSGKGSLKNLCYAPHITNKKAVIALVHQTLKYKRVLVQVLSMAQVPGFRYCDLKKYERINNGTEAVIPKSKLKNEDGEVEITEDDKYELELLEWKRNRAASFHNKLKDKDGKPTDAKEEGEFDDFDAEDDNLGVSLSWHSCFVNINIPTYKFHSSQSHASYNASNDVYLSDKYKDKKKKKDKKRGREEDTDDTNTKKRGKYDNSNLDPIAAHSAAENSADVMFRARYLRETMLVLAYDLLFGKGLPRFDTSDKSVYSKDTVGIFGAMKLITSKLYNIYVDDEQMKQMALPQEIGSNTSNTQNHLQQQQDTSSIKPKWLQEKQANHIDISKLLSSSSTLQKSNNNNNNNNGTSGGSSLWATTGTTTQKSTSSLWATTGTSSSSTGGGLKAKPTIAELLNQVSTGTTTNATTTPTSTTSTATTTTNSKTTKRNTTTNDTTNTISSSQGLAVTQGIELYTFGYRPPNEWGMRKRLQAAYQMLQAQYGSSPEALLSPEVRAIGKRTFPRYVRVNTLRTTTEAVIQHLVKKDGYIQLPFTPLDFALHKGTISETNEQIEQKQEQEQEQEEQSKSTSTSTSKGSSKKGKKDKKTTSSSSKSSTSDVDTSVCLRHDQYVYSGDPDSKYTRLYTQGCGLVSAKSCTSTTDTTSTNIPQNPCYLRNLDLKTNKYFWLDAFVPNLLCFVPQDLEILGHTMVTDTKELIIQDKASCLPPLVLLPTPGSTVIDGCSAPGNKTSLLANLLNNQGTVYAIELNSKRANSMRTRLHEQGASCVQVVNTSFFLIDPQDPKYKPTEYILLDPSCSGSGNPSADVLLANDGIMHTHDSDHVRSLSDLQTNLLQHALKFPNVKCIVYSTCSIYDRENEGVVKRILPEMEKHGFELVPALPRWPCRGHNSITSDILDGVKLTENSKHVRTVEVPYGEYTARVFSDQYHTGGFYVACFRKKDDTEYVTKQRAQDIQIMNETLQLLKKEQEQKEQTSTNNK